MVYNNKLVKEKQMKDKNDYGFYSGGYVFDRLDRHALLVLRKKFPELKNKQLYTAESKVFFERQLCDLDRVRIFTGEVKQTGDNAYYVENIMRKHSTLIAYGFFTFVVAKHNYCELKKGENNE